MLLLSRCEGGNITLFAWLEELGQLSSLIFTNGLSLIINLLYIRRLRKVMICMLLIEVRYKAFWHASCISLGLLYWRLGKHLVVETSWASYIADLVIGYECGVLLIHILVYA